MDHNDIKWHPNADNDMMIVTSPKHQHMTSIDISLAFLKSSCCKVMAPRLWNAVIITITIIASVKYQHVHHKKCELCKIIGKYRHMISAQTSFAIYCASSPYYLEVVTPFPPGPNTWSSRKRSLLDLKMSVIRCFVAKATSCNYEVIEPHDVICNLLRCIVMSRTACQQHWTWKFFWNDWDIEKKT